MGAEYTGVIVLKGDATQLLQALDQANTKIKEFTTQGDQASQKVTQMGTQMDQAGQKTQGAAAKFNTFSQNLVGMVGGFTAVTGGVLGMVSSYTSLEKAQTIAQRSADRLSQAKITEQQMQDKVNQMQAKGLTGTEAYNLALQKLTLQHSKVQTAEETATIAQARANEKMAEFATQIVPQALSVMGGLASSISSMPGLWSKLQGSIGGAGGGLASFITGPVGIALIGIGALATVLTLVATNAFGFRDALNAAGKAIGDAIPFLQPLLIAIKALGEQAGLTGGDVKQGFNGMNQDVKNFVTESGSNLATWKAQLDTIGKDMQAKDYGKALRDIGTWMSTNFASNVKGFGELWASALANMQGNLKGMGDALVNFGGLVSAGAQNAAGLFMAAFEGLASWFMSNVGVPIINAWNSVVGVFSQLIVDPIKQTFAGTAAWFQTNVVDPIVKSYAALAKMAPPVPPSLTKPPPGAPAPTAVVPPIWAPGGGIIPAAPPSAAEVLAKSPLAAAAAAAAAPRPPPPPPTLAAAVTGAAGTAGGMAAALTPMPPLNLAAFKEVPIVAKSATEETDKAYNAAIKFAHAHNMVIPASVGTSRAALTAYINSHMDYQKELDKVSDANAKAQLQYTATAERLRTGRAATEGYTAGVLEQKIALQGMQEQHLKNAGSLATLEGQIKSGTITNAAFKLGVDEQRKAFDDAQVAISNNAGKLTEYGNQVASGKAQNQAYTQGVQEQYKAFLDSTVAVSKAAGANAEYARELETGIPQLNAYNQGVQDQRKALMDSQVAVASTQGKLDELDRELATGQPQWIAYAQGVQQAHGEFQQMILDTSKITGQVAEMDKELASGQLQLAAYNKGLAQGALDFDNFVKGLAGGIGQSQEMNFRLAEMARQYGALPPGMDLTNENLTKFIQLSANVAANLPGAVGELNKFKEGFDAIAKGMQPMIDAVSKAFETLDKSVKKPLADIPKEVRKALSPEALNAILEPAKMEGLGNSYGGFFASGFIASLKTGGEQAAAAYLQGFKVKDPEQKAEIDKITGYLAQGTQQATIAAAKALDTLGPKGQEMAQALIQSWNSQHPGETISSDLVAQVSKTEPYTKAGAAAASAFASSFQAAVNRALSGISPTLRPAAGAVAAGAGGVAESILARTGGGAARPTAAGPTIDTSASVAALKALEAQAQAVFNNIVKMAQGAGVQISAQINIGVVGALASFKGLVTQAQADMNQIPIMAQGVAKQLNQQFATGASDAAGSIDQLMSQMQADMNNMARMPTGVASSLNKNFNTGAQDAAGALNGLQSKAQGVMNNIVAAAKSAANAVAAVGTAIRNLPNKTVTITVNNSQALSAIRATQSAIDNLHGKSVTNTVTTRYVSVGTPALQAGYHGIVNAPTTVLVGEAGPERLDVTPMTGESTGNINYFTTTTPGLGRGGGGSPPPLRLART